MNSKALIYDVIKYPLYYIIMCWNLLLADEMRTHLWDGQARKRSWACPSTVLVKRMYELTSPQTDMWCWMSSVFPKRLIPKLSLETKSDALNTYQLKLIYSYHSFSYLAILRAKSSNGFQNPRRLEKKSSRIFYWRTGSLFRVSFLNSFTVSLIRYSTRLSRPYLFN